MIHLETKIFDSDNNEVKILKFKKDNRIKIDIDYFYSFIKEILKSNNELNNKKINYFSVVLKQKINLYCLNGFSFIIYYNKYKDFNDLETETLLNKSISTLNCFNYIFEDEDIYGDERARCFKYDYELMKSEYKKYNEIKKLRRKIWLVENKEEHKEFEELKNIFIDFINNELSNIKISIYYS